MGRIPATAPIHNRVLDAMRYGPVSRVGILAGLQNSVSLHRVNVAVSDLSALGLVEVEVKGQTVMAYAASASPQSRVKPKPRLTDEGRAALAMADANPMADIRAAWQHKAQPLGVPCFKCGSARAATCVCTKGR